jgi:hypothetical protein
MAWATPSTWPICHHSQVKMVQSQGRLLLKRGRMILTRRLHHPIYRLLLQPRWLLLQVNLHQLHQIMFLMDELLIVGLWSYNKRCTHYFVNFILILIRIIYYLNRTCYYSQVHQGGWQGYTNNEPERWATSSQFSLTVLSRRTSHIFWFAKAMKAH